MNFIARPKWQPVIVIDRRPKRRPNVDVIGMIVSLAFLLAMFTYAITEVVCR